MHILFRGSRVPFFAPSYRQADSGVGGGAGGAATDPPAGGADADLEGQEGEVFDAARAKTLIDKLRGEVKAGKGTAKELETTKARLTEIERAQMTEADRIKADAADKGEKLTKAEADLRQERIERQVEKSARKLNVVDEEAALRLLDHSKIEYGTDGAPTNIDALLSDLVAKKPYLVAVDAPRSGGSPANPGRQSGGALTLDQIKAMTPQQVSENWDAVQKVMYPGKK